MSTIFAVIHYPGRDAFMKWRGQTVDQVNEFLNGTGSPFELIEESEYEVGIAQANA